MHGVATRTTSNIKLILLHKAACFVMCVTVTVNNFSPWWAGCCSGLHWSTLEMSDIERQHFMDQLTANLCSAVWRGPVT